MNLFKFKIKGFFTRIKRGRKNPNNGKTTKKALNAGKNPDYNVNNRLGLRKRTLYLFLIAFVLLLLYYFGPIIYNVSTLQFSKAKGDKRIVNEDLSAKKMNILLIGAHEYPGGYTFVDGLILVSYDFDSQQLGVFAINPDIRVNVPGLNRQMEIRGMYNSALLKGKETSFLMSSVESLLAVKIDRYMYISIDGLQQVLKDFPDLAVNLNNSINDVNTINTVSGKESHYPAGSVTVNSNEVINLFASNANGRDDKLNRQVNSLIGEFKNLKSLKVFADFNDLFGNVMINIKTNMTKAELFRLGYNLLSIRDDTVKKGFTRSNSYYKLPSTNLYGSYMIIQDRLDTDISSILFNIDIFKEHAEIEVFNASNTTGLASNRARWIQNLGANVVKIGNADHVQDEVDLYCVNPDQYPETIRELRKIFSSNVTLIQEKYYNRQIGDIVIVMGRDY